MVTDLFNSVYNRGFQFQI